MMKISHLVFLAFVLLITCHCEKNGQDMDKVNKLNQKIAGTYEGLFTCVSYTGQSYPISKNTGLIELVAVGTDSLLIQSSEYCIYSNTVFAFDAASSTNTNSFWNGNSQFSTIRTSYDSVFISVPRPCSCGWLGSEFKGKKQ